MLRLNGRKVYFDFEIPVIENMKVLLCCDNPYTSQQMPNIEVLLGLTSKKLSEIQDYYCIGLNYSQWQVLIEAWYNRTDCHKLWDWSILDWMFDYIKATKHFSDIMEDDDYTSHSSVFRERQKYLLEHIGSDFEVSHLPIELDEKLVPEYSWMVEDYIWCKLHNIESKYSKQVEKQIEINRDKWRRFNKAFNGYGIDINMQHNLFFDYYFPLSDEKIKSNYIHIQKCLKYMDK